MPSPSFFSHQLHPCRLLSFLLIVSLSIDCHHRDVLKVMTLTSLWDQRNVNNSHLFPTRTSAIYPDFAAIRRDDDGAQSQIHLSRAGLDVKLSEISATRGILVHSICSYRHLNVTFYTINTVRGLGQSEVLIDANMTSVERKMAEMTERRIKINFICVGADNDTYSAVWHHSPNFVWHFIVESLPIQNIIAKEEIQMKRGYFIDCFQTYRHREENVSYAIVIWRKSFAKRYKLQYGTNIDEMIRVMESAEMIPISMTSLPPRRPKSSAISRWILWHGADFEWSPNRKITKNVKVVEKNWEWIENDVEKRMRNYDIPSISMTIIRNGKLEFNAAFGYADILHNVQATTNHRYRIASISKLITAMGIGELLTKYNLNLLTLVFGENGILHELCDSCHPFFRNIRIIHLLEHTSGGWPHTSKIEFDRFTQVPPQNEIPKLCISRNYFEAFQNYSKLVFKNLPSHAHAYLFFDDYSMNENQTDFLKNVVENHRPISFPGEKYFYSNVGYMILGRIISKVSGKSYEQFVRETILIPLGIEEATIVDGDDEDTKNGEVHYYSHDNANAYSSWSPRRMNSAAGWSMRAEDVAKLMLHLEKNKLKRYRWIMTPSKSRPTYGRGIQLGFDGSLYHIGSLAGTEAIAFSLKQVQVAILSNKRGKEQNEQTGWMEKLCKKIANY